jgi:hypothetical protein
MGAGRVLEAISAIRSRVGDLVQRIVLVVLGTFIVVAGAASRAPAGVEAGTGIVALGIVLLASRRRRLPRARVLRSLIRT